MATDVVQKPCPPQLKPWLFQKGHTRTPNAGRPKGSKTRKSVREVLQEHEEQIALHALERSFKSDRILEAALNRLDPLQVVPSPASTQILVFLGSGSTPRQLDVPDAVSTLMLSSTETPTLSVDAVSTSH